MAKEGLLTSTFRSERHRPGRRQQAFKSPLRHSLTQHDAPDESCACGMRVVQDIDELLGRFDATLAAAAIARVSLSGRILPGYDIPNDDPPTTLRGERAELLDMHLSPALTARSGPVADQYPSVPVFSYSRTTGPPASSTTSGAASVPSARRSRRTFARPAKTRSWTTHAPPGSATAT